MTYSRDTAAEREEEPIDDDMARRRHAQRIVAILGGFMAFIYFGWVLSTIMAALGY